MSIESVPAPSVYVLPQSVSPLAASELALASRPDVKQPDTAALSKVVSRLQTEHREASQPEPASYIQVNEIHLLPSPQPVPLTGRAGHGRIDVYV
jgi:hypothetical protein